jgi:carotenoid cleavage dioxygenase-like enzyme
MYEKLLARDFSKGFFGLFAPENIALEMMIFKINQAATSVDKELDYVGNFSDKTTMMHIWHMSNAYELDSNTLVIDASGAEAIDTPSCMSRITISLDSGNVKIVKLCPELQLEFPQANPLVNFHDYRFAYVLKNAGTTNGSLVKLDVRENRVAAEAFNVKGYLLAEPVFVPRLRKYGALTQEEEEDGAILLVVTDTRIEQPTAGHSWLSILAPSDLSEIARISCPIAINAGLHSNFFPTVPLVSKV